MNNATRPTTIRFTPAINAPMASGSLEVICGSMFSGKTEELIRRIRRAKIARQSTIIFKHSFDNQRAPQDIASSHDGNSITAFSTDNAHEILRHVHEINASVIGIDEVQFFPNTIVRVVCDLINEGRRVILAGLDLDFRGIPFGPIPTLLTLADDVTKLRAICSSCGANAHFTQRLIDGQPARYSDPIILVGAQESYQARCRKCFCIDHIPSF